MKTSECPSRADLIDFHSGKLSEASSESLGEHIDKCESCRSLLKAFDAGDDKLEVALRSISRIGPRADASGLQRAESLVKAIGHDLSAVSSRLEGRPRLALDIPESIGPYQIVEKIGKGGMGTVYKALHSQLEKVVAIKILPSHEFQDSTLVERFRNEMRAVGQLEHHHIVRATDAGDIKGIHFLVMEYVEGKDLSRLMRELSSISVADACEIIRQAALGLQYAHDKHLVHRDVKPANLMLTRSYLPGRDIHGVVKILDLGLARLRTEFGSPDTERLTVTGQMMGTLEYMAPEQGSDTRGVDRRADIYSLGATLYRLLTGRAPFPISQYGSPMKMLTALATQAAPSIRQHRPDLPTGLVNVVDTMLARDPEDRYASAQEVAEALTPFTCGSDLLAILDVESTSQPDSSPSAEQPTVSSVDVDTSRELDAGRAVPLPARKTTPRRGRRASTLVALSVAFFGVLACAGIVFFVQTRRGWLKVEINDPAIRVQLDGTDLVLTRENAEDPIVLTPGPHSLRVRQGQLSFGTEQFVLKRGETVLVRVQQLPGRIQVVADGKVVASHPTESSTPSTTETPQTPAKWFKLVSSLPSSSLAAAVKAELLLRNPSFHGNITWEIANGRVSRWAILSGRLDDLSPLIALKDLRELDYPSLRPRRDAEIVRSLENLETLNGRDAKEYRSTFPPDQPAAGAGVTQEWIDSIKQLPPDSQLAAVIVKLKELNPGFAGDHRGWNTDGRITRLDVTCEGITDISPLRALESLSYLSIPGRRDYAWVTDLAPLQDMLLDNFSCANTAVSDLRPLAGMPLTNLELSGTNVRDLSPLRGIKLERLRCAATPIVDLSPLSGMPLTYLDVYDTQVSDLAPLRGMPLSHLSIKGTLVTDLQPLVTLRLTWLNISYTKIKSLSLLEQLPLQFLNCRRTQVKDLSALRKMPLKELIFDQFSPRNLEVVRSLPKLTTINSQPAEAFWKSFDGPSNELSNN